MTMQTRSQTRSQTKRAQKEDQDFEDVFRAIHRGVFPWPHNFTTTRCMLCMSLQQRILWWTTGVEEGAFGDEDVPEEYYAAVYKALHGN